MILRFSLGIGDAREIAEELARSRRRCAGPCESCAEERSTCSRLAAAQQPVVDEDAVQPRADRLVDQDRRHRRVDAARQTEHDFAVLAHLCLDRLDDLVDDRTRRPIALEPGEFEEEVAQHHLAIERMRDLRVELDQLHLALVAPRRRVGAGRRRAGDFEASRQRLDNIAMAHPDARLSAEPGEERPRRIAQLELRVAIFAAARIRRRHDLAAEQMADELHAVADAEHGDVAFEERRVDRRRPLLVDRARPAAEDHGAIVPRVQLGHGLVRNRDLANRRPARARAARSTDSTACRSRRSARRGVRSSVAALALEKVPGFRRDRFQRVSVSRAAQNSLPQ
jgi:hypothetical protein